MKYTYKSSVPTVLLIEGQLITIHRGDVVTLDNPPSSDFVRTTPVKKSTPKAKSKVITKKVITDATNT